MEIKDKNGKVVCEIPDNLKVGGSLDLRNTKIKLEDVPEHLRSKCVW